MPLALIALLLTPTTTILLAIIAFLIVVVALLGFVFLKARSRKLEEDARARDELAVREQESEFSRAVDAAVYARNAEDATKVLVTVLQDQLWLNVLAVYAGREDDSKLKNTLPQGASLTGATEVYTCRQSWTPRWQRPIHARCWCRWIRSWAPPLKPFQGRPVPRLRLITRSPKSHPSRR